jgi:polyhydroxybutyrate depolymerase
MAAHNGRVHQTGPGRRAFVAYPNALDQTWNLKGSEDVAFIKAMIDEITRSDASLDRSRVFATGAGLGGALAQRLACESSDRFAAIALVSTGFPRMLMDSCKPEQATPVLLIDGGIRRSGDINLLSAAETFEFWRKKNGCTGEPAVERRTTPRDHTVTLARPCRDGAEVRFIKATDDGKPWMEEASREIAEFVLRFRRLPKF